jgi:protein dithiol oxidoreductase (disulfide-forming)
MNSRRTLLSAAMASALLGAASCSSLGNAEDHARIEPAQPVATGDKIEVIEFFWYGCAHCFDMQPKLRRWTQRQPADVALRCRPAVFSPKWEAGARVHHVLDSLGETQRLADAVFEAVQVGDLDLQDEAAWFAWAAEHGLDRQTVVEAWRSPEAQRQVAVAREAPARYRLRGVPAFVVDGKYLTSNSFTGSAEDTLDTLDRLVDKARKERASRSKSG